ncbi:Cilia- and flagella-associated protein 57 like protein [Argiope bruennichi]|uniref:Cilia- and flagella-associated protein 57 like protein n=1 Tax=Argiope bruennichi TaxID=94029 RepID=A0A8T0G161_ARGBR|nr:Cilia- and flagella-associated protein 57 like protein [Argiope bruennichi]
MKKDCKHFSFIPEENEVTAVGFGSNNLLAIAVKGQKPLVSIFNMKTNEKRTLTCANKVVSNAYVWVSFAEDGERLGAQGGPPDWAFVLWNLEKRRLETVFHPFRLEPRARIYKFAFCPSDSKHLVAVGHSFLRAYHCKENQKIHENALHGFERSKKSFHCIGWMKDSSLVIIGTSDGMVLVFQNMHLIPNSSERSRVLQMTLNPQEDTVGIATKDGRILTYSFADRTQDQGGEDVFRLIQDFQHTHKVLHADTLPSVSMQASCSNSRITLRDLSTEKVFLREELSATPYSLSVCPLSTCLAIGYESAVKVFNIVLDVLVETKRFDVTAPSQVHILLWRNNNHLLSSDEEGTIYEWNIPRKQSLWSLSVPDVIHTCITSPLKGEDLYAAGGDSTIRRIKVGAVLNSYSLNVTGISAMSAIEHWLLVGTEDGKILGVNLSLSATNFQLQCQTGRIIHFAVLPDIKSIMAVDEHGIASTWSFQNEKRRESLPSRAEVLIDLDKQKEYIQCVENLEEELMRCTQRTDASREQQRKKLEEVQVEASEKYRRIEDSLRVTAEKLKEELEEIRRSLEENYLNMKRSIESEIEDNKKDFHKKMSEEAMNLQREKEERARIEQEFEDTVSQRIKEKKMVLEDFQTKYSRHMEQLQVLKDLLDKEKAITSEVKKECENFNRSNEKEEQDVPQTLVVGNETYSDMKFKKEKERHISEMEELDSQFVYHKECCKSIEDAFKTKHRLFRRLHDLAEELKGRVNQVQADISRIEDVLKQSR